MANTPIAQSDMSNYVPIIIAGKTLQKMKADAVFSKLAYVDFSQDLKQYGDTVQIPKLSTFTAQSKVAKTPAVLQDMDSSKVDVKLGDLSYIHFLLEDTAAAAANQNLIQRLSDAAGNALLEKLETSFINLFDSPYVDGVGTISVTNGSATVTGVGTEFTKYKVGYKIKTAGAVVREITAIASDTSLTVDSNYAGDESGVAFSFIQQAVYANGTGKADDATILKARSILRAQRTPANSMALVANLDDYSDISTEAKYIGADSINAKMLREDAVGRIRGANVYESNFMEKAYSPMFNPLAIGAAFRILNVPQKDVESAGVVYDEETGMSIRYIVKYSQDYVGYRVSLDMLYGMSIIDPEQVVLINEAIA